MAVTAQEWLELIEREYVRDFVVRGGSAAKFVVAEPAELTAVSGGLARLAAQHGLASIAIDAASARLHMIQDVFFAIARELDWGAMAQEFVERLFASRKYEWPSPREPASIEAVAQRNRIDATTMRRELLQWFSSDIMQDPALAQDFRVAMHLLCQRRVEPDAPPTSGTMPVLEWLRGELRSIGALRAAPIVAKITRHNGRAMLRSLCRWLRSSGRNGLCLTLDIRQLGKSRAGATGGIAYSPAAVLDGFEVLRQVIDDAEHFVGLMLVVLADEGLLGDDTRRSLHAYQALKMRIWDDVRPSGRDNPLAPLVRLAAPARCT